MSVNLIKGFGQVGVAAAERGEAREKFREQFRTFVEELASAGDVESGQDFG